MEREALETNSERANAALVKLLASFLKAERTDRPTPCRDGDGGGSALPAAGPRWKRLHGQAV
jgi:hypothetical protein